MNVVIMEAIPSTSFAGLDEAAGNTATNKLNLYFYSYYNLVILILKSICYRVR